MSKKDQKNIVEVCPEILAWWDYEKNGDIDPHSMSPGNASKKLHFKCPECSAEIYRTLYLLTQKNNDGTYSIKPCQKCHPTKPKLKVNLVDAVPDIEKYWDYEKNEGKLPSDFGASASDKVWTKCPVCGTSVRRNVRFTWEKDENGVGHVITCRICGKRKKENSLIELIPEIKNYWIYEKNEHNPEYYTVSSGKRVYTRCPECGCERFIAINDLVQIKDDKYYITTCVVCRNKKSSFIARSVAECFPDIYKYWDDSNDFDPKDTPITSDKKVNLHCPSCGKIINRRVVNSFKKDKETGKYSLIECLACTAIKKGNERALNNSGPLVNECPEFVEWWDFDNNDIDIRTITRGSSYKANLKCPLCSHKFNRIIDKFVYIRDDGKIHPNCCPECGYNYKGHPEDNLLKLCPEIVKWWNYDKNSPFRPEHFSKGSQTYAYLTCPDCGMELYGGIHGLVGTDENGNVYIRHEGRCRKYRALESENNILAKYPEVKEWWDYDANNGEGPEEYTIFSSAKVGFKCPKCGVRRTFRISDAFKLDENGVPSLFNCAVCNGKRVLEGYNSLADTKPGLVREWSPNNELKPTEVLDSLYTRVLWICPTCHGEYSALIKDRNENDNYCPYCSNKRVLPGYNSFKAKHKDLVETEWCYAENILLGVDPDNILDTYNNKVWWKCTTCGRKYIMSVKERLLKLKRGHIACHQCRGRRWKRRFNV